MIGKMVSFGFDLATLPARMAFRGTRAMVLAPGDISHFMEEIRQASDEVAVEIQRMIDSVDAEMSQKAAHLSTEQKEQAAYLAMDAAEKHLSMAAVNVLRAVWLAVDSSRSLERRDGPVVIDQEP